MRTLEFREPSKVTSTSVHKEYWRHLSRNNFERSQWVITKYGIVALSELDWETNTGQDTFTYFQTIINGYSYTAFLNQSKLSDRQIKWMSTHFMKQVSMRSKLNK